MDFALYWFMFPVAIAVATCAMLSGIGGAALFTPIFILVFPLLGSQYVLPSAAAAIATALLTQCFGFLSGFIGYSRRRLIDRALALRIMRLTVPVAVLGALAAKAVHPGVIIGCYSLLIGVLAVAMLRSGPAASAPTDERSAAAERQLVDAGGRRWCYPDPRFGSRGHLLSAIGAFLTGMVSVGVGEVTVSQLIRRQVPIEIAAATSVLVVIATIAAASFALIAQLVQDGGWRAVPWNLVCYSIPGVLIGGQIGPLLQGRISQRALQRAIAVLFVLLSAAMGAVALKKSGIGP